MYYQPAANPNSPNFFTFQNTIYKGQKSGPFVLTRVADCGPDPYWQIDHWPTGYSVKRHVSYHKARSWMSRHKNDAHWRFEAHPFKGSETWRLCSADFHELSN